MKIQNQIKNNKGITLIALVITIVLMLILATVTVNVKSITGGYDESDTTLTDADKKATVELKVDNDSVYKQTVDKNSTGVNISVSGKGTISLKLMVDSSIRTYSMNLNNENSYTFK